VVGPTLCGRESFDFISSNAYSYAHATSKRVVTMPKASKAKVEYSPNECRPCSWSHQTIHPRPHTKPPAPHAPPTLASAHLLHVRTFKVHDTHMLDRAHRIVRHLSSCPILTPPSAARRRPTFLRKRTLHNLLRLSSLPCHRTPASRVMWLILVATRHPPHMR
jgi:hypothetical protein